MLRLKLWYEVGPILSQELRQHLFAEIEQHPMAKRVKADALVIVDVGQVRKQIAEQSRAFEAAEATVTKSRAIMGGEPMFKGTGIPVRLIAAMLDLGAPETDIMDGCPILEPGDRASAAWSAQNFG